MQHLTSQTVIIDCCSRPRMGRQQKISCLSTFMITASGLHKWKYTSAYIQKWLPMKSVRPLHRFLRFLLSSYVFIKCECRFYTLRFTLCTKAEVKRELIHTLVALPVQYRWVLNIWETGTVCWRSVMLAQMVLPLSTIIYCNSTNSDRHLCCKNSTLRYGRTQARDASCPWRTSISHFARINKS